MLERTTNLMYLKFGIRFNQSIDNLPITLTQLVLGRDFNILSNNLPVCLEKIKIYEKQTKIIKVPYGCEIEYHEN
jgi:hypothetical protein